MTDIKYDTDVCATDASLGWDVVKIYDGKVHRLGTYVSPKVARDTAEQLGDLYHVLAR